MRYIDISRLEVLEDWPPGKLDKRNPEEERQTPQEWRARLARAEAALRNLPPNKTRSQIMADYSDLWSAVKDRYRELSNGKCWYCESRTDSGEMDHYRPKARVIENKQHPGYWWLAFEWRNWRYCCDRCNRYRQDHETGKMGGKGNRFPLLNGEQDRIWGENDYEVYEDLLDEEPLLLDPTMRADPQLLSFTRDGLVGSATNDKNEIRRVTMSIRAYHLDHSTLSRERRGIYVKVSELARDAHRYGKKWAIEHDRSARDLHNRAMKELGKMIAPDAEYSATARACLKELRKPDPDWAWVDRLLTAS